VSSFLLVRFQLDYVLGFAEPYDSIESLNTLPNDMETAYVEVLKRVEANRRPTVIKVLSWLFHAEVPLHKDEVREAIAVRIGQKELPKPLIHADALVQYCHGLVVIDERTGIMRFSHFTVKEFLSLHYQDDLLSRVDCGRVCLTYLAFSVFENGQCWSRSDYKRREHRFGEYASEIWASYIRGQGESDEGVFFCLGEVLKSQKKVGAMLQMQQLFRSRKKFFMHHDDPRIFAFNHGAVTGLHVIAREGLSVYYARLMAMGGRVPNPSVEDFPALDWGPEVLSNDPSPLLSASIEGHSNMVLLLIKNGADVNARYEFERWSTSLHAAAGRGHLGVVNVLLEEGAELALKNPMGETALHVAVTAGNRDVVRSLLQNGADVNAKMEVNLTPLHLAAHFGQLEVAKLLLDEGAEVNARGCFLGWYSGTSMLTPLHLAGEYLELTKVLLDRGAEVGAKDKADRTVLHWAAARGRHKVVRILLERGAEINASDIYGITALHHAATRYFEVVKLLLENGAEVNHQTLEGDTALLLASRHSNMGIVNLLLRHGADVKLRDNAGFSVLHAVPNVEMVEILCGKFRAGDLVNARTNDGSTPLHYAVVGGRGSAVVQALFENGAEINSVDVKGSTALHIAASLGSREVVKALLNRGAELKGKTSNGMTVFHIAAGGRSKEVLSVLLKALDQERRDVDDSGDTSTIMEILDALRLLTTKFPNDYLFRRELGDEYCRKKMYQEARDAYDTSVRILLTNGETDIDSCPIPNDKCYSCGQGLQGYYYKCPACCVCPGPATYCQKCAFNQVKHIVCQAPNPESVMLSIPSQRPFPV